MNLRKTVPMGPGPEAADRAGALPAWVPEAARNYLEHTEGGRTIRALAREAQVAPSTILRRVRRVESSRDDPLVDAALRQLSGRGSAPEVKAEPAPAAAGRPGLADEMLPVLRRLSEPGTVLAVAREMERGVIVREGPEGDPQRLAVVDRALAESMALREWIACPDPEARVSRYRITAQGRAVLRTLIAEAAGRGLAAGRSAPDPARDEDAEDGRLRHMRSLLAESPLQGLARRRDGQGAPFLPRELVAAGERLREDFEVAQRDAGGPPDWEAEMARLLGGAAAPADGGTGAPAARARVLGALAALGPGLAEVCLRCCCRLEGLEAVETAMGWSARSGKIVLRIALDRLSRHYGESGRFGPLIG